MVAGLADLCDLKQCFTRTEQRADGHTAEIEIRNEILTECAVCHICTARIESLDFAVRQKAHLSVPVAGVRVALQTVVFDEQALGNVYLLDALLFACADCEDLCHRFSLRFQTFFLCRYATPPLQNGDRAACEELPAR